MGIAGPGGDGSGGNGSAWDGPDDLFGAFELDIQPTRFAEPALLLGPEQSQRLAGALAQGLDRVGQDIGVKPKVVLARPGSRRRVVLETVFALHDAGALVECVHLSAASGLTHARMLYLWVRALEQLRATTSLMALITRLESDPELPSKIRRNLLDLRMHNQTGLIAADHQVFVDGPVPATLAEALKTLPAPGIDWVPPRMVLSLALERGLEGDAAQAFAARLNWGRAAVDYLTFLKYYAWPASGGPQPGQGGPDDGAVRALAGQLKALMVLPDPNPLVAAAKAGKSIVLVSAHAGLTVVAPWIMLDAGLPLIGISAKSPTDLTHPREKTLGTHGNFQADFLKAVKILRREPHLVQLLPDGGFGGASLTHRFRGRDLALGQGAAMMAWQGQAAVFFFGTRWRDDGRMEIYVETGPVAEKGGDRAAFDTAFYDFYLGCLDAIVMGPPENMAPGGGFWRCLEGNPADLLAASMGAGGAVAQGMT
ncbi:Vi polysaccharide export protein VexE (plasmid) [Marinibacterium anthonyi]|nr:Vi polysaccharide export protein VexE [Marinibacterium anthonyi]